MRIDSGATGNRLGTNGSDFPFYANSGTNSLAKFNEAGTIVDIGAITGLQAGEEILGMDFRPINGQLYGLGANTTAGTGRFYIINKNTGAATQVGTGTFPLGGTQFGFDFNPTVDRIRLITNTGQNLRINPNNAAVITDGALNGATTIADGVTANDANDADSGDANNLHNYPLLTGAATSGSSTTVSGTLTSTANRTFRIEFFSDTTADASGNGEGRLFISASNVTTNPAGAATISGLTAVITAGNVVSATATDLTTGDTSEFSATVTAAGNGAAGLESDVDPRPDGNGTHNSGDVLLVRNFVNTSSATQNAGGPTTPTNPVGESDDNNSEKERKAKVRASVVFALF